MEDIGPVDYFLVGFPGNDFRGGIGHAIAELIDADIVRVLDIAFVVKDADGNTEATELAALPPDVQDGLEKAGVAVGGLFSMDDLMSVARDLEPNSSAALIVWENMWARKVANAIRDAGGMPLAFERIPPKVVQAARDWALEQANA
jgi:hypothetical protein